MCVVHVALPRRISLTVGVGVVHKGGCAIGSWAVLLSDDLWGEWLGAGSESRVIRGTGSYNCVPGIVWDVFEVQYHLLHTCMHVHYVCACECVVCVCVCVCGVCVHVVCVCVCACGVCVCVHVSVHVCVHVCVCVCVHVVCMWSGGMCVCVLGGKGCYLVPCTKLGARLEEEAWL